MTYGLIGEHLPHSYSKEIHERLAPYTYDLHELAPHELAPFLRAADFRAVNVTIPYKEAVIPYLWELDGHARAIGAVNTIVNRGGRLYGYNTDFFGMKALLDSIPLSLRGKKVLILGTGGTSKTARAVAASEGASVIVTVSRGGAPGVVTYEDAMTRHTDANIIINTTPCGMFPFPDGGAGRAATPIDISPFPALLGVVDAIYNPLCTNLVLDARARGIPAEGGLYMLVAQALRAVEIFLDTTLDKALVGKVTKDLLRQKQNIILTGMPGGGKSTVGRLLAEALHRPFIDSDAEIVKAAGRTIPELFASEGEAAFRDREHRVIAELAAKNVGCVIATGGGAILRDDNLRALSRNGRIYFLDRPPELLLPTPDRPLSSDNEALLRRYRERYGRYCATCHIRIDNRGTPEEAASAIREEFFK